MILILRKTMILCSLLLIGSYSYSQTLVNAAPSNGASTSLAFIDGSSSDTYNGIPNAGKGIIYPRTDLTTITSVFDDSSLGGASYNPNYYDGLVVFNTGTGAIPANGMGTSASDVEPGFYYYRNTGTSWNSGEWLPLGSGSGGGAFSIQENTPTDTQLINSAADQEKVIELVGTTDGVNTTIDLGTTHLAADAVNQFRKANIYNSSGALVLIATGDYDSSTNVLVTGNGMMNLLLPAASDYKVELFYTAN